MFKENGLEKILDVVSYFSLQFVVDTISTLRKKLIAMKPLQSSDAYNMIVLKILMQTFAISQTDN